ncbi:unnamed protein product [Lactuca virosa]|uniref:Clp R domain-containing protein n=1 Tax=Lactuca virosa TaxID=75947 RepID=A0AAU9N9Q7_9ASTR|nr:unnamed protein product [Lactuca virosa]
MKAFGLWVLFLVFATALICLCFSSCSEASMNLHKGRKLKEDMNLDDESNIDLFDYHKINPVPSSKASIRPGPIQHGTPLMPFIPKDPPPGPDHGNDADHRYRVRPYKQIKRNRGEKKIRVLRSIGVGSFHSFLISGHTYIGPEHLLLALLDKDGGENRALRNFGAYAKDIHKKVMRMIDESKQESSSDKMPILEEYGVNLAQLAETWYDPVTDERKAQIKRVIQILGIHTRNNPCLVGKPGVGKTYIVQGMISLDMHRLFQGRYEERLKKLMEEVEENGGEIILFIDQLRTLFEAGASETAICAANILKPALASGKLQCIGATTDDEYRKHIEKDPALERLFEPVKVPEATFGRTMMILKQIQKTYEYHHKLRYTREALLAAAHLSFRCISERGCPGKAIDLIDEAGSLVCRKHENEGLNYRDLLEGLKRLRELRLECQGEIAAFRDKDLKKQAARSWDLLVGLELQILEKKTRIKEMKRNESTGITVTEADIEELVSSWKLHI